ncbi:glycosyltransferase family 2 protein [Rhodospirillaceae bacterium SYSU D60014]|uniref:glycosyltransferase family 2 protein n=1 Tax=Virgifigura deserti TaxID=2268457 RepID=UPI000E66A928
MTALTLGLPVFNGSPFLARTIESLLDQTFRDFSILISDNCSRDETKDICERYARLDRRIAYIRQDRNIGAIPNYNFIFTASEGRYFKWAAADDICHPDYLMECVGALDSDPGMALCHSRVRLIDEFDEPLPYDATLDRYIDRDGRPRIGPNEQPMAKDGSAVERFKDAIRKTPPCFDVFGVIRRDVLAKTRLHRPWYGSDRVLLAELALYGRLHRVDRELFFGREHAGQSIALSRREQARWIGHQLRSRLIPANMQFRLQLASAVMESPLGLGEKLECLAFLCSKSTYRKLLGRRFTESYMRSAQGLSRRAEP